MIIIEDTSYGLSKAWSVTYKYNNSFIVLATVITIVNYDRKTFIVQATCVRVTKVFSSLTKKKNKVTHLALALSGTNSLAYLSSLSTTKKKGFIRLTPWLNVIKVLRL